MGNSASGFSFNAKTLTVKPYVTKPDDPTYHLIEDGELEKIMKIGAPRSLLVCTTCTGYVLGEIRTICDFITNVQAAYAKDDPIPFSMSAGDVLYMLLTVAAISTALATGVYAASGKSEITRILKKIRSRPPVLLNHKS